MVNDSLVADADVEPSRMYDVPLLYVLHCLSVSLPNLREVAVFLDNIVCTIVCTDNDASVFDNAPFDTLNVIFCLPSCQEGVCENCKCLLLEDVLLYSVLEASSSTCA